MKIKIIYLFLIVPFLFYGQEKLITGTVKDSNGNLLPYVKVSLKDREESVSTDFDGVYSIDANEATSLIFSFQTYKTKEVEIDGRDEVDVILKSEGTNPNDPIVQIGYGDSSLKKLTGSDKYYTNELFELNSDNSIFDAIQSSAPGVRVFLNGKPGAQSQVSIRGIGTLMSQGNPLYVVNGVIVNEIDAIDPYDIESMNILTDASLLAVYGTRGANGVILITLKQADMESMKFNVSSFGGIQQVSSKVPMANAAQANEYWGTSTTSGEDHDWMDELTSLGYVANAHVSAKSGSKTIKSYLSANFYTEEGVLNDDKFSKANFFANFDFLLSERFTLKYNVGLAFSQTDEKPVSAFQNAYQKLPSDSLNNSSGLYEGTIEGDVAVYGNNPIGDVALFNYGNSTAVARSLLSLDFKITDYLNLTSRVGLKYLNNEGRSFVGETQTIDPNHNRAVTETFYNETQTESGQYNYDFFLTFDKTLWSDHNFNAIVGASGDHYKTTFDFTTALNVPEQENLRLLTNGDIVVRAIKEGAEGEESEGDLAATGGYTRSPLSSTSYFGRLNYDFDSRYLLSVSGRMDTADQFTEENKWGNTYAIGLGWLLTNEDFMASQKLFNYVKLRGSFGELANQRIPTYRQAANQVVERYLGIDVPYELDSSLGYEMTKMYDFGLEFSMLENRLSGQFSYYNRRNMDAALARKRVFSGANSDFDTPIGDPMNNKARIRNQGFELALNWQNEFAEDFKYNVGVNFSRNFNEIETLWANALTETEGGYIYLDGEEPVSTKRLSAGHSVGDWYMYKATGVVDGKIEYEKADGTRTTDHTTLSEEDKKFLGSSEADIMYGVNFGIEYKGFDLAVQGYGSAGAEIYNAKKQVSLLNQGNIEESFFNDSDRLASTSDKSLPSSYFLENGDYFRINNITVGYTFGNVSEKVDRLRVFVTAKNPFTFTNYSGYNYEFAGDPYGFNNYTGNSGIDSYSYPSTRTIVGGVILDF